MPEKVRLVWEGKRPAQREFTALPDVRCIEQYGDGDATGRLIRGDNLCVMAALREELAGRIALIYLDPPFFTGADWQASVLPSPPPPPSPTLRERGEIAERLPAYTDDWGGDLGAYLQWMLDRLTLARELLAEDGCLYVHLSWHAAHYVKLLMDEIFGARRFQNEIIWCYREAINSRKRWNRKHDTLLFYSKGERFTFNYDAVRTEYAESHIKKYRHRDEKGVYRLMGRGIHGSPLRSRRDLPQECETQYPGLTYRHYLGTGTLPVDYWQIDIENQASYTRTGYPTQKPERLLERILLASSNPGDLIADFCCGSGTTLAVAARLGRRWIGCDAGALAIHTARKRLLEMATGGFTVEEAEGLGGERGLEEEEKPCVHLESASPGWRLRLEPGRAAEVDLWAVQWLRMREKDGKPFCPQWWSARTRRQPDLETISAVAPAPDVRSARVLLADAAGRSIQSEVKIMAR